MARTGPWNATVGDSLWTSLRFFNVYRLILAAFFFVIAIGNPASFGIGEHWPDLFLGVSAAYAIAALVLHLSLNHVRRWFGVQLTAQVIADIAATTLLMYASGGLRSDLGVLILISLAGGGLLAHRTLAPFFAALATVGVLGQQLLWTVKFGAGSGPLLQSALLCLGYFVTVLLTNWLAGKVIANEEVATARGIELANQMRINTLVIRDVQDGVLVTDETDAISLFNPQAETLLGRVLTPGMSLADASTDLAARLDEWRAAGGHARCPVGEAAAGRRLFARFHAAGVEDRRFALIFLEDLSRLEDEAQRLKLVALGRLTAGIAHEIRNPLSAITHAADLLVEEKRAAGQERLARIIRDNAFRLDRMVRDILDLNRRDRAQPESFALGSVLRAFKAEISRMEDLSEEAIAIETDAADAMVEFDRVHLQQILWNLVRNAWRHSRQQPGSIRLRVTRMGGRVELHVLDDGPGVRPEDQAKLFEPFFTTYSKGTGLGLYISRELAVANGAVLDYVVRPEGADFRLQWLGASG